MSNIAITIWAIPNQNPLLLQELGIVVSRDSCVVDGCQFGLCCSRTSLPLLKSYRIASTSAPLLEALSKPEFRCGHLHKHGEICGGNAERSGRYTPQFVDTMFTGLFPIESALPVNVVEPAVVEAIALSADPLSTQHLFSHRPALPNCPVCQQAKQKQAQARRSDPDAPSSIVATVFSESVGGDHIIFGRNSPGINNETVCLVVRDAFTDVAEAYPCKTKSGDETESSFRSFINLDAARELRSDNSPELLQTANNCGLRPKTACPYRPTDHGKEERFNQTLLQDARTFLLQSGLDTRFWPYAMKFAAHTHNTAPRLDMNDVPWYRLHNEQFPGPSIPFGSRVTIAVPPEHRLHKADPGGRDYIFLGYHYQPMVKWTGDFVAVDLELLTRGEFHLSRTKNLRVPALPWTFPVLQLRNAHSLQNGRRITQSCRLQSMSLPYMLCAMLVTQLTKSKTSLSRLCNQGGLCPFLQLRHRMLIL